VLGARALAAVALVATACKDRPAKEAPSPGPQVTVTGCAVALRPLGDVLPDAWVPPAEPAPAAPIDEPAPRGAPAPRVRFERPSVQGAMSVQIVQRVLKRHVKRFEECYASVIRRKPAVAGTLVTQFTVGPAATVIAARADGLDDDLGRCVTETLQAIEFPKAKGGGSTVVRQPITFRMEAPGEPEPEPEGPPPPDAAPPPPPSPLAALTWADEGVDPALADWVATTATPALRDAVESTDCFDSTAGSLRTGVGFGADGAVVAAEAFGLGDAAAEDCVRDRLAAFRTTAPPSPVAVTCDVTSGAAAPWRITVRPDHIVIDADAPGDVAALRAAAPDATFVITATSSTPVRQLARVIAMLESPRARYRIAVEGVLVSDMIPRGAGPARTIADPRLVEISAPPEGTAADLRRAAEQAHAEGVDRVVIVP
jgi:hypothetical protein